MMRTEAFFIARIAKELPERLGKTYTVRVPNANAKVYSPDIIITNNITGRSSAIELKGSSPSEELPYAVIPSLRKLKRNNPDISNEPNENAVDDVILVSLSKVSESIKSYLAKDDINVVELKNEEEEITNRLKNIILLNDENKIGGNII